MDIPQERKLITEIPGPASKELLARRENAVPRGVFNTTPIFTQRAAGAIIEDVDGNRLIDLSTGIAVLNVGNTSPAVVKAVQEQAERYTHTCFHVTMNEPYVALAEKLNALTPGDHEKKTMFANSGAEAVENAVKIARTATGRDGVVVFDHAFHGRTLLAMSLTSRVHPYKTGFGPFAPEIYRLPYPYPYRSPDPERAGLDAIEAIERAFTTVVDPESVAAAIVEPIQGEGGFVVPTAEFLPKLAELCRRHGVLVIADEIQAGSGRTGRFLASEHFGFEPDIVILAKALASGYPLSAVVGPAEVMDAPGPSAIGGTYVGNPVACAAANAALDVIEEEGLLERSEQVGKVIRSRWEEISRDVPEVGDIRGIGAMIGVEMVRDRDSKEPAGEYLSAFMKETQKRGVVTVSCGIYHNVLRHLLPLVITDEQLEEALGVLADSAVAARHEAAPVEEGEGE
jgi:4-aminobutyrate aminotransferase / (S)-3-amino-2-methylpropionate transaminase / 5-aminovalerate transaminase